MRALSHLSYANVIATLALFLALGGTAVAGTRVFVTGADVRDHSLTGVDFRNGSVGANVLSPAALLRLKRPKGLDRGSRRSRRRRAGRRGRRTGAAGACRSRCHDELGRRHDQSNYVDLTPLASTTLSASGDYVIFTNLTVHNTGASDEYLNCGYRVNGNLNGASGVGTTAGTTSSGTSAGVVSADGPTTVEFLCQGNGATSYDISNVTMRVHFLG